MDLRRRLQCHAIHRSEFIELPAKLIVAHDFAILTPARMLKYYTTIRFFLLLLLIYCLCTHNKITFRPMGEVPQTLRSLLP